MAYGDKNELHDRVWRKYDQRYATVISAEAQDEVLKQYKSDLTAAILEGQHDDCC